MDELDDLDERIAELTHLERRGVSTWDDARELARLERKKALRDFERSRRSREQRA